MKSWRINEGIKLVLIVTLLSTGSMSALAGKRTKTPPPPVEEPAPTPDPSPTPTEAALSGRIKTTVSETGLYCVTAAEIASLLNGTETQAATAISDGKVAVGNMGSDVAWLRSGDAIYFYGEAIDNMYGGDNVYWITVGASGPQMGSVKSRAPRTAVTGGIFQETVSFEEQKINAPYAFSDPDADFWFWGYALVSGTTATTLACPFDVKSVSSASATAQIQIAMKGGMNSSANPDNQAKIYVNGTLIGQAAWDGTAEYTAVCSFNQSILNEGANELVVESVLPSGASFAYFFVDSFRVSYMRDYEGDRDQLVLIGGGNSVVTAVGYSGSDLQVFDVSNARLPKQFSGTKIESVSGGYRISFSPLSSSAPYLVATLSGARAPQSAIDYDDTGLQDPATKGEYVVITADVLMDAALDLAAYRASQGFTTRVASIGTIYDEFNEGIRDPLAIQAFLEYATANWALAPRYVVLAGQGSVDYTDSLGNGDCMVPARMVTTSSGLRASDTRFADLNDDGAPDLAIGRLPVTTAAELQGVIAKIRAYETGGAWKSRIQMVADNPDSAGDYTALSDDAANHAPAGMDVSKAYLSQASLADVRLAAKAALNDGCAILNYSGHGLLDKLADESVLSVSDLPGIQNAVNAPVVLSMSCDVGTFELPGYDSLSERLVTGSDGAVAVWASTGSAYSDDAAFLNSGFLDALSSGAAELLGDAVNAGLVRHCAQGYTPYMRYTFNLMGDPATRITENTAF